MYVLSGPCMRLCSYYTVPTIYKSTRLREGSIQLLSGKFLQRFLQLQIAGRLYKKNMYSRWDGQVKFVRCFKFESSTRIMEKKILRRLLIFTVSLHEIIPTPLFFFLVKAMKSWLIF